MARSARLAVAVLAAGSSRRFGVEDKLAAQFRGKMLGLHATDAIPCDLFRHRWVIVATEDHPCAKGWRAAGFEIEPNSRAEEGMGTSVALAASLAIGAGADALLIALADMPLVPQSHFTALANRSTPGGVAVSSDGSARMPPAIFGAKHLPHLARLGGDIGARAILSEGEAIECPPEWLVDIDTPEALAALA
ncbi:nucleotidyltransferase family protein [Erythrobacter sp. GH1-10]|uniref:nucleotidyltransferase family protein n=1 Tax=Erythrobacter sp. GH1-10 TaxID=3349334 RepID=UPI0038783D24